MSPRVPCSRWSVCERPTGRFLRRSPAPGDLARPVPRGALAHPPERGALACALVCVVLVVAATEVASTGATAEGAPDELRFGHGHIRTTFTLPPLGWSTT